VAMQARDTAAAAEDAIGHFYTTRGEPVTEAQLRLLLPFMDERDLSGACSRLIAFLQDLKAATK